VIPVKKEKSSREIKILIPAGLPEIIPGDAKVHLLRSYREFLLGIREIVDHGISMIDSELEKSEKSELKKIEVE